MEIRVISPKPIQANIMCPLLPADHQCVAYVRQRIPIDRTEIECGMSRCVSGGRVSSLTSDVPSACVEFVRRASAHSSREENKWNWA